MKTFEQLYAELSEKAVSRPEGSGTVAQLDAGVHAIGKKIVEEAAEVWMAASTNRTPTPPRRSANCSTTSRCSWSPGLTLDDVYAHSDPD